MTILRVGSFVGSACVLVASCTAADEESVTSTSQAMTGDDMMMMECPGPAPIMQAGDFDGDGTVNAADVAALSAFKNSGDYAAFYDMNADGKLDGSDVSIVAHNLGKAGTARDREMAELWRVTSPYRDIRNAYAAGYVPFTPNLMGHGIHFANFNLILSWGARTSDGGQYHFHAGQPEGLNYTADGKLIAAFYYQPGAVDLATIPGAMPSGTPLNTYYKALPVRPSFSGLMAEAWHHHIGPCFGGATSPVPGFDQCMTLEACKGPGSVPFPANLGGADPTGGAYGQMWSAGFHMLHVWMYEYNACGPFAGIDEDVSMMAPMEPHHGECTIGDVVPVLVP